MIVTVGDVQVCQWAAFEAVPNGFSTRKLYSAARSTKLAKRA